jgi:hypothetical protein
MSGFERFVDFCSCPRLTGVGGDAISEPLGEKGVGFMCKVLVFGGLCSACELDGPGSSCELKVWSGNVGIGGSGLVLPGEERSPSSSPMSTIRIRRALV